MGFEIAAAHGLSREDLNETFLVVENGQGHIKSDAGIVLLRHLRPPWSGLAVLRFLSRFIRDPVYTLVARRRYRWFGHKQNCFLPPADAADRFIDR